MDEISEVRRSKLLLEKYRWNTPLRKIPRLMETLLGSSFTSHVLAAERRRMVFYIEKPISRTDTRSNDTPITDSNLPGATTKAATATSVSYTSTTTSAAYTYGTVGTTQASTSAAAAARAAKVSSPYDHTDGSSTIIAATIASNDPSATAIIPTTTNGTTDCTMVLNHSKAKACPALKLSRDAWLKRYSV